MTLSTYDDLVKQIENWGHRDDLGVLIPDFIKLAETEIYNNQVAPLMIRDMESINEIITNGTRFLDLPDNYESSRSIRLSADYGEIRYQSPEQIRRCNFTGQPLFFTIIGNQIEFDRIPDSDYTLEIQCFVRPLDLSETNQTNSVLLKFPTIYLYGALTQLFAHSQDDQQAAKYNDLFFNAIKGANKSQKKGRYGPSPTLNLDGGMIV